MKYSAGQIVKLRTIGDVHCKEWREVVFKDRVDIVWSLTILYEIQPNTITLSEKAIERLEYRSHI